MAAVVDGARTFAAVQRARALTPGEIAWLAAIPTALVTVLSIALLGPEVGRTLLPTTAVRPWSTTAWVFVPEPAEHGRYVVSLAAPLMLALLTLIAVRARPQARPTFAFGVVIAAQAAAATFVVLCLVQQHQFVYGVVYTGDPLTSVTTTYFSLATYAVAAVLTAAVVLAARSSAARERCSAWIRDTRVRQITAGVLAVLAVVVWLSHALNTEQSIGAADTAVAYHMAFTFDETYAVIDGRSPLVDFASQYGSLWPYALAAAMSVLGTSIGVFSALTVGLTGLALLAVFALLRRVARSAIAGLLLFLPVLATSLFIVHGELENRYTFGTLTGSNPMRYAGPLLLAWLVGRHLDGARPRQPWPLFVAAGLVAMNNADAGIPALGATLAALLWTGGRPTAASLGRLALALAVGLLAAFAVVSTLTLLRTGSLPHLELLLRYSRLFAAAGFGMLPMPVLGLHVVIYLTFVAAIGVATARALASGAPEERAFTGMLVWSGVFGLGAGAYYVGRSHPESLVAIFMPWSLTLALLTVVALRALAQRDHRPLLAPVLCVFGFAVAACSLAQTPLPWQQLERIDSAAAAPYAEPAGQAFVARNVQPEEHVLILMQLGHRIAEQVGATNVAPYTGMLSMPLQEQVDEALDVLRDEGGRKVFLATAETPPDLRLALRARGFTRAAADRETGVELWAQPPR